ncbi:hypothetical protein ACOJB1_14400 [Enterococcus innesii]|uniref:hypothetical protein n=1 Tax=Enterococcus innesii TaxID=2839759 RepID=UPI003B5C4C62
MNKSNQEFLNLLKKVREEKDIDQIGELFMSIISMYGLTTDEVCSLSYYMVDRTLQSNSNKALLRNEFSLDVDKLGIDGKLSVMKAMVATYVDKVSNDG